MSSLYRPAGLLDILQVPLIGRFLRWRRGRLVLQSGHAAGGGRAGD